MANRFSICTNCKCARPLSWTKYFVTDYETALCEACCPDKTTASKVDFTVAEWGNKELKCTCCNLQVDFNPGAVHCLEHRVLFCTRGQKLAQEIRMADHQRKMHANAPVSWKAYVEGKQVFPVSEMPKSTTYSGFRQTYTAPTNEQLGLPPKQSGTDSSSQNQIQGEPTDAQMQMMQQKLFGALLNRDANRNAFFK